MAVTGPTRPGRQAHRAGVTCPRCGEPMERVETASTCAPGGSTVADVCACGMWLSGATSPLPVAPVVTYGSA